MAYINVAEWTPDQVTDWLKGLDDSMYKYVHSFTNNEVDGRQLLNIRPYELEQLGMVSIGHQEIVLEAVENLRNFHFNLDKENLQFMALHVATASRSLHRQLAKHCDASKIETQILNDITRTIGTIKPLIGWLDRAPFRGQYQFTEICRNMLRLGLEMATIAQRDRFVERPVEQIRVTADKLERLANYIIQDITDPMLLQPASLNLVTLKKRDSELGFSIESNYHGIHRVTDIKYNSPAHNSGKIEDGDEIVQINYQTVVAWQYKTVIFFLHESLPDVLLTLKKRPKHTKMYGQIYMQPYRLPSKKRVMGSRWGENLPSPRAGFLTVPEADFNLLKAEEKTTAIASSDTDSSCSDILTPTDTKTTEKEIRLYYPKPRTMLQRRNTICGDELLRHKCGGVDPLWHERKTGAVCDPSSPSLRDKSVSFGFGLEIAPRPTTCIGIATSVGGKFGSSDAKGLFTEVKKMKQVSENEQQTDADIEDKSKPGVSKVVRFDAHMKYEDHPMDDKYICNVEDTILETFEPIPFADEEEDEEIDALRNSSEKAKDILEVLDRVSNNNSMPFVEAVNIPIIARRGRLDKSHSTPAYDNSGEESDTPPAVEPRKEFLVQTPPVPPPRPRKQKDLAPSVIPPPPPKPPGLMNSLNLKNAVVSTDLHNVDVKASADWSNVIVKQAFSSELCVEANELHTPSKTRTLTLKKKHSLIAKRRNINLKVLGTGDIQGHLYRRTKDRRGVTFWARLYFVMMDTILYGFRSKESLKASCVIFLPGFTVSLAKEVYSKPYAFKVYHSAKTFYLAAESQDALNQWVDFIRQAVLQPNAVSSILRPPDSPGDNINTKDLFSETDSSGEESESMVTKNLCTPSPQGAKDIASTFSSSSKSTITPTSSTKHERRYLGSLRKLTKGSLPFKCSSSAEKKPSSDIPVPTDQYRSYRKVPGGSFGIQIGTNTPGYHHGPTLLHPYNTLNATHSAEQYIPQRKLSISSSSSVVINDCDSFGPPSSPAPTLDSVSMPLSIHAIGIAKVSCNSSDISFDNSDHSAMKKIPYNFIHASNPNLVEFDFQTSKTLDYSLPKINPSNSWDAHHNIQGFVTLKDLMLQKQEEEAQEMYNNRVLLGVEKKDERKRNALRRSEEKQQQESNSFQKHSSGEGRGGGGVVSKTQSRSLPKTPDYEISFKPDDEAIKKTRTKEGLKLRDFGYELISGDEPIGGAGATTSRQNSNASSSSADHHNYDHSWTGAMKSGQFLKSQPFLIPHKSKKHSNSNCPTGNTSDLGAAVSSNIKKKGKLEAFKSERMFQFNKQTTGSSMTLPLNKKSNQALSSIGTSSCGIKKSHTYNNDLKVKEANSDKYDAHRKNSAPIPIFSKLTTFASGSAATSTGNGSNKSSKEKRLLGSPLLHRTIFGNHHHYSPNSGVPQMCIGREYDSEIFSQVIFPKVSSHHSNESSEQKIRNGVSSSSSSMNISAPEIEAPPPPITHERDTKSNNTSSNAATPEYPNMECPPVFEPEIYSLTDSSASLPFLLRRKNSGVASLDEKQ